MLTSSARLLSRLTPVVKLTSRTTVTVKRVYRPPVVTSTSNYLPDVPQKQIDEAVLDPEEGKYMVYEVEEEKQEQHRVKVILLRNVDDFGVKGQIVSFPVLDVHKELIQPGYAVYHTEENIAKYADFLIPEDKPMNSSESARLFIVKWSKRCLDICMNMDNGWTIDKWHIAASLRKHRVWADVDKIEIPGGEISGPDLSLENKEFIAILTMNDFEKVKIRCRIHHHTSEPERAIRLQSWYARQAEPVWEHERQELLDMNRQPPSFRIKSNKKLAEDVEKFYQWKNEREKRLNN